MPALAIAENVPDVVQMMVLGVGRIFWVQFLFRSIPNGGSYLCIISLPWRTGRVLEFQDMWAEKDAT